MRLLSLCLNFIINPNSIIMSKLCNSETNTLSPAEQLKAYWLFLGEKHFEDMQLQMFNNGYFRISTPSWRSISIYDNLAGTFIPRLQITDIPYLTFHVFGNGYMAAAKDNGFIEIYAPNGKFFAQHKQDVKWWGEVSAYVYVENGNYYLADITETRKTLLLGKVSQILNVEQNINGLTAVKYYKNGGRAVLYNAEAENITPIENAENILFFANGSFIICANNVYYLYNARMECVMQARFQMKVVDGLFCSMHHKLYNSIDGSAIDGNNLPLYTSEGWLTFKDGGLFTEKDQQILAYCPVRPQVFADHLLHFHYKGRDLIFDVRLSAVETRQILRNLLAKYDANDISQDLYDYFLLLVSFLDNPKDFRQKVLKGVLSD